MWKSVEETSSSALPRCIKKGNANKCTHMRMYSCPRSHVPINRQTTNNTRKRIKVTTSFPHNAVRGQHPGIYTQSGPGIGTGAPRHLCEFHTRTHVDDSAAGHHGASCSECGNARGASWIPRSSASLAKMPTPCLKSTKCFQVLPERSHRCCFKANFWEALLSLVARS